MDIRKVVREKYAAAITRKSSCCGSSGGCCGTDPLSKATQIITGGLYSEEELQELPAELIQATFGCGNPTALADLHAGEIVLDLGSGAGLDALLSARRVGPHGKVYGLDMTEEMLAEARKNQQQAGINNIEFLKGHIEDIPLPENEVDVVISNCVINLSADKDKVMQETYRVLKPGGRFAVSDVIATKPLPDKIRQNLAAWAGCIAGVMLTEEYQGKLAKAGFQNIDIQVTRVYDLSHDYAKELFPDLTDQEVTNLQGALVSAFIRAKKPARSLLAGVDYTIRRACANDFPAVETLLTGYGLTAQGILEHIETFFIADCQEVIGVIGIEQSGTHGLLRSLAVHPAYRKSGIAAMLIAHAQTTAKSMGLTELYLLTYTADKYLSRFGFSPIDRAEMPEQLLTSSVLGCACPSSSVCMKRTLV